MANVEKIQGNAVLKLIKELQQNSIPLKIQLLNGDYERLTHIAEICKRKRANYFLIDYHENLRLTVDDLNDLQMRFEFDGKDNIHYAFETESDQISRNMLWIKFPEIVYCYQRRGHFRLEAPHGTCLYFKIKDLSYHLLVVNISLGGTLGVLVNLTKKMEQELRRVPNQVVEYADLIFPPKNDNEDSGVTIKQFKIIRLQKNTRTGRYECAIEFKEIVEKQRKKLTTLFYQWQREYLKKRRQLKG